MIAPPLYQKQLSVGAGLPANACVIAISTSAKNTYELKPQLIGRHKIMTITRGIAAAAMLAGLAVGTASAAWADTTMSGHYIRTETGQSGQSETADWYATPCGNG